MALKLPLQSTCLCLLDIPPPTHDGHLGAFLEHTIALSGQEFTSDLQLLKYNLICNFGSNVIVLLICLLFVFITLHISPINMFHWQKNSQFYAQHWTTFINNLYEVDNLTSYIIKFTSLPWGELYACMKSICKSLANLLQSACNSFEPITNFVNI